MGIKPVVAVRMMIMYTVDVRSEGIKRVFEDYAWDVTLAIALRLGTILAGRSFFTAFDSTAAACCQSISLGSLEI